MNEQPWVADARALLRRVMFRKPELADQLNRESALDALVDACGESCTVCDHEWGIDDIRDLRESDDGLERELRACCPGAECGTERRFRLRCVVDEDPDDGCANETWELAS